MAARLPSLARHFSVWSERVRPQFPGLVRECVAREPADRTRDASAVAARVTAYLSGVQEKLRRAELDRIEERARRRMTTVIAAGVLAIVAIGAAGWYWVEHGRQASRSAAIATIAEARLLAEQASAVRWMIPVDGPRPWPRVKQAEVLLTGPPRRGWNASWPA